MLAIVYRFDHVRGVQKVCEALFEEGLPNFLCLRVQIGVQSCRALIIHVTIVTRCFYSVTCELNGVYI